MERLLIVVAQVVCIEIIVKSIFFIKIEKLERKLILVNIFGFLVNVFAIYYLNVLAFPILFLIFFVEILLNNHVKNNSKLFFLLLLSLLAILLSGYVISKIVYFTIKLPFDNSISVTMIMLLVAVLCRKYLKKSKISIMNWRIDIKNFWIVQLLLTLMTIFIVISVGNEQYVKKSSMYSFIVAILSLATMIIGILYIYYLRKKDLQKYKEEQFLILSQYTKQIEELYKNISGFRHDYSNIMLSLELAIRSESIDEIKEIYRNVVKVSFDNLNENNTIFFRLNKIKELYLKSLLFSKISEGLNSNLNIQLEVEQDIENTAVSPLVLIRILSILIDNALEAAENTVDKNVALAFVKISNGLVIMVENSSESRIDLSLINQRGYTSKSSTGLGLSIVNELIKEYDNIDLKTESYDTRFIQKLFILDESENE